MSSNNTLPSLLEIVSRLAQVETNPDSLEFGSPVKGGGTVKIYSNYDREAEFKAKIDRAIRVRMYTQDAVMKAEKGELPMETPGGSE